MNLQQRIVELYQKTATELPKDIIDALVNAQPEENNYIGCLHLEKILENIILAKKESKPICQDTGTPIFYVKYSRKYPQDEVGKAIRAATKIATKRSFLRPNAVNILKDKNIGNEPVIHFVEKYRFVEKYQYLQMDLILKGGGSENVSAIYQLPNQELNAERNLDGVKKCILDAVFKAQGKGCPPYIIGVAMGGNIEQVAHLSKKQLLRRINDKNSIPKLARVESQTLRDINQLGIGPLGLGGDTTALAVKIDSGWRHPASFFVGISFSCWCLRRQSL